jgi:hypothetical protein
MGDKYPKTEIKDFPRITNYRVVRPGQHEDVSSFDEYVDKYGEIPDPAEYDDSLYIRIDVYETLRRKVAKLVCLKAAGWEGAETFSDCGKCVVCRARRDG